MYGLPILRSLKRNAVKAMLPQCSNSSKTLAPANETIALAVALDAPHWVVAFYEKHGIVISNKDALILDGEEKEEAERRIAELDQKVEASVKESMNSQ